MERNGSRIVLLTAGSRGDTQPFVALGVELDKLGFDVEVAASESLKNLIESNGLRYRRIRIDIKSLIASGEVDDAIHADNPLSALKGLKNKAFMDRLVGMQEDLMFACENADAVVYHPGASIGHFTAQQRDIRSFIASPFPLLPTAEYPSLLFSKRRIPRNLNMLTHRLFTNGFWMATKKPIRLLSKRYPATFPRRLENPLVSHDPVLVSCSNSIFPTPFPGFAAGFWFLDEKGFTPPSELMRFLGAGDPPVYFGFGSIGAVREARDATETILSAVARTGSRAIIATGFGGLARLDDVPAGVYMLDEAPHSWLFPQVSMVVHHGGAGTTAAGYRAGVPSIIIPHGNDQFAWGKRTYELGVGPKPIMRSEFTSSNLADAIISAGGPEMKERAKKLGDAIRRERGAEDAARHIADMVTIGRGGAMR